MADLGALISIAENVFKLLQSPVLQEMKDWESDLGKLNKSVSSIKNMLLDADTIPQLSHGEQGWVDELKEALYEADDLFDEVITIAKQKELNAADAKFSKKVLDKVGRFFSSKNRILLSYHTSQVVKSIQQKLDAIAINHARYEFKVDHDATLKRKVETCSFLDETRENIIGREDDVKDILDMLFDPNVEENVGFIAVVGIGGLGKTTLAQLVFNHARVITSFEKRLWVCVSDQDGKKLDVKAILGKIIESSTKKTPSDISTMESMQTKLQEELRNKKYLLILDDVGTEDSTEWSKLSQYLTIGGSGSRVVITTRSERTAEVVLGRVNAHSKKYMLKALSDENSWRLFELTAFKPDELNNLELITIGKKIVEKCSNIPLAIKVLGTLLYDQKHIWESFEKKRLPQFETAKNSIISILKLSYDNLKPSLKSCFSYCALFPKDFEMNKRELISLWMAQGYIDDSEDHLLILLKRCFFQDVKKNDTGEVVSFKMHDLMHDLAQEVAGDEIIVANSPPNKLSQKVHHLSTNGEEWTKRSFHKRNIRTCYMMMDYYLSRGFHLGMVKPLVTNWSSLRSLRLFVAYAEYLPESIGQLIHLRYLDLSRNVALKALPNSITKLFNLQSLNLNNCGSLKWPKDFCKLVNLRLLDNGMRGMLTCMPLGIDQLTNLRHLSEFAVCNVGPIRKQFGGHLKDLKFLVNLRGQLNITFFNYVLSEKENKWEGGYLEHINNLKDIHILFYEETNNEALIEKLQPNRNLMILSLSRYNGTEIPRWGRACNDWSLILPNLVKIKLWCCERLDGIPMLSNLKHLKELSLFDLDNLEYMVSNAIGRGGSTSKDLPFFPSLKILELRGLGRLKGWWGGGDEGDNSTCMPSFPCLSKLRINSCPNLTSIPPCPTLESLEVVRSNKALRILPGEGPANLDLKLKVEVDSVGYLTTLPATRLTNITIESDDEVKSLSEIEEVFKSSSSLRKLKIRRCGSLTSISGVLEHLTALESLSLGVIPVVDKEFDDDIPWRSLRHNLRSLKLDSLDTLQMLPRGMKHLTALESLSIECCKLLKGLPEWISCLPSLHSLTIFKCPNLISLAPIQKITSLEKLKIIGCPDLKEECREPSGKEWPNIRHIPDVSFFRW